VAPGGRRKGGKRKGEHTVEEGGREGTLHFCKQFVAIVSESVLFTADLFGSTLFFVVVVDLVYM